MKLKLERSHEIFLSRFILWRDFFIFKFYMKEVGRMEVSSNPNPDGRSLCWQGLLCRKQIAETLFVSISTLLNKKG